MNKENLRASLFSLALMICMGITIAISNYCEEHQEVQIKYTQISTMETCANIELPTTEVVMEDTEDIVLHESTQQVYETPTYTQTYDTTGVLTASKGVNYYEGHRETYYNLPMEGVVNNARNMGIEGEYWVREDGAKMYGDYVIVAANLNLYPRGSLVQTSLGTGIVLDTGGFAESNPEQWDIATAW